MEYVLCQDCLNVLPYTDERHNEDEYCSCGGQLCGCEDCQEKASEIMESK
ncbi:hypothetical protein ACN08P_19855 [Photobacterium leiognathi subsp. mandapamensis]